MTQFAERQKQDHIERPFASIVLLTFNQERFVQEALQSLLNQDYEDIEIVVSDDCSTDSTWEQIQTLLEGYAGPKKVFALQNQENLGIVDNYATAFKKTSGDLIFMAAGDDISLPNRCSKSIQFWLNSDKRRDLVAADAIDMSYTGEHLKIKETDNLEEWTVEKWFKVRPFFFGASFMVTRKLLNLAPLNNLLPYEDQCLVFRSQLMGGAIRLPEALVCHRRGGMTQTNAYEFAQDIAHIRYKTALEILEHQQFLIDATILEKQMQVEKFIERRVELCRAIHNLFIHPKSLNSIRIFIESSAVPAKQKYRYLRYYLLYPILIFAHSIRDILRKIRKKERR